MKYTNKHKMPAHIFRAIVAADTKYSKVYADFSVTGLLRPAHMAALERAHADEIEQDAADAVFRAWGTIAHAILADGHDGAEQEIRHFVDVTVQTPAGAETFRVSGQIDVVTTDDAGRVSIIDTKTTSAAALQSGDVPYICADTGATYYGSEDWEKQVNIYAFLYESATGKTVDGLRIAVLLRDWSKFRAGADGYPHAPALDLIVQKWPRDQVEGMIRERIAAHMAPAGDACEPGERWESGPSFRVVGPNAPDKNFRSIETATKAATSADKKGGTHAIEETPGTPKRCAAYCTVSQFCPFWLARGGK